MSETSPPASTEPPAAPPPPAPEASTAELREWLEKAQREAAGRRHEVEELREQLQKFERERESVQERAVREAVERDRVEQAAAHQHELAARDRIIAVKDIRALAADKFADPEDAVAQLAHAGVLDQLLAEEDTGKRTAAARTALDELLKAKAYLARDSKPPLVTQGQRSGQAQRPRERSWLRG
jgi:hypothetical protein